MKELPDKFESKLRRRLGETKVDDDIPVSISVNFTEDYDGLYAYLNRNGYKGKYRTVNNTQGGSEIQVDIPKIRLNELVSMKEISNIRLRKTYSRKKKLI